MKIAIDGPAGSGKSTVAKEISKRLGLPYLNTGLVYRGFAYVSILENLSEEGIFQVFEMPLKVEIDVSSTEIFYKNEDISQRLISEDVGERASQIAKIPAFRERINQFFRSLVGDKQVVAEGRDTGTHIFPEAQIKFFITASAEERAKRRYNQLKAEGIEANYEDILKAIVERDERDKNRPQYPFRPAEDAITIDTTGLTIEEVVERVLSIVKAKK
ncbi:MAG: (d)CMP kinase [Aquificaceae bacterium]